MVPVRLPVACVTIPQTPDSLAPCCVGVLSGEVVRLEVDKEQLALNHSLNHTQQNPIVCKDLRALNGANIISKPEPLTCVPLVKIQYPGEVLSALVWFVFQMTATSLTSEVPVRVHSCTWIGWLTCLHREYPGQLLTMLDLHQYSGNRQ